MSETEMISTETSHLKSIYYHNMIKLYEKLYKIQQLALAVSKDGTNPHFKSAYPTLDNTISVIIPEINKI